MPGHQCAPSLCGHTKRGPCGWAPTATCRSEEPERVGVIAGQHTLGLLVMLQRHLVGFTANTGLLVTTKRGMGRVRVVTVHPYPSGLNVAAHPVSKIRVAGPDAGTQAKLGVIGNRQS